MRPTIRYKMFALGVALLVLPGLGCGDDSTAIGGPGGGGGDDDTGFAGGDVVDRGSESGACEDFDGDGRGVGCVQGPDCDDGEAAIYQGHEEICDGLDNNCDGRVDEDCRCTDGAILICYTGPQATLDVGRCRAGWQVCEDERWGDCVNQDLPQEEVCDSRDNDCDGGVDEGTVNACGGCGPVPVEICGDGLDNDCDGVIDQAEAGCDCDDRTGQPCYSGPPQTLGVGLCHGGSFDCFGEAWGRCRGEVLPDEEVCDGQDNDCDGLIDENLTNRCGFCGEPEPEEICDGTDNDCDGAVDEGLLLACGQCSAEGLTESCGDGFDNDCDGLVDEGCSCEGDSRCYAGPPDKAGVGACVWGSRSCDGSGEFWAECTGYVLPQPEICDDIDNDCDGLVDVSPLGCDVCGTSIEECDGVDNDCDGQIDEYLRNGCGLCFTDVEPEELCGEECCDGRDNDCDGLIDETLLNACGLCGDSCYVERNEPSPDDVIGEGGELIGGEDPENPSGRPGVTLSSTNFIPPYAWIANHTNNTVTRFNMETLQEEGRYWVGSNPSRTGVDLDGNVWIGGRNDGRLTKILWDTTSCPDRNENGEVDTSYPCEVSADCPGVDCVNGICVLNSAADPYADECVVYSEVPNTAHRSIRGSAPDPTGRIWIGFSDGGGSADDGFDGGVQSIDPLTFELGPYIPPTGAPVYAPDGDGVQQPQGTTGNTGRVYGLVVDSRGHLYTSSYNRNTLARFDTTTQEWVAMYTGYVCGSYGIGIDSENRVWTGGWPGCEGVGMFDPEVDRFYNFAVPSDVTIAHGVTSGFEPNPPNGCPRNYCVTGVAAEPATDDVWASFYARGYTGRLHVVYDPDAPLADRYADSTWTFIGTTRDVDEPGEPFLPGVSADLRGVGFDTDGYAWTHGLGSGRIFKIDPATNTRAVDLPDGKVVGVGTHYTYSDFTGSTALSFTSPRSTWRYTFDTTYPNAQPDKVIWEAWVPARTSAGIRLRVLDGDGEPLSSWVPNPLPDGTAVYEDYPTGALDAEFDVSGFALEGQIVEIEVRLSTSDPDRKPIVHAVDLYWQRP